MKTTRTATRLGVLALAVWAVAAFTPTAVLNSTPAYVTPVAESRANYTVFQLDPSRGVGQSGWAHFGDGGFYRLDYGSYVQVTGLYNGSYTPAGYWAIWRTPGLPGNLYIDSVTYESIGAAQSGRGVGAGLCTDAEPYHLYCGQDWLLYQPIENQWIARLSSRAGSKFFKLGMYCGNACPATTWTNGAVRNMAFNMRDVDGPGSGYAGDSGVNVWGGWTSGNKDVRVWSTDGTSGVERATVYFDGNASHPLADTKLAPCNRVSGGYSTFVPCPTGAAMIHDIDTTQLSDGPHTLQHVTYDASGNASTMTQNFKVDNTKPAAPDMLDLAGENANGWQSVNDFDLSWQNGGEVAETATQSGISQSCYDVNPGEGQATDPAPVCVNGAISSLPDIQVPDDGIWNTQVWTVDRAGNASDRATEVMRLDTTVPGRTPGVANGWVGLDELLTGKYQFWTVSGNYTAINSQVCGYGFSVSSGQFDEAPTTVNVVGDVTQAQVPAGTPEGISWAHFRAISCAGLYGPSESVEVKVDLTKPQATVTGTPASGWTNNPGVVTVTGTDKMPGSGMDPAPSGGSVVEGASVRFDLDGAMAKEDAGGAGSFDAASLPEGAHTLTVKTFDVARNYDEQTFSLGVDKMPPSGAFAGSDPSDPTVFKVPVTDALAGVTGGEVQYAPLDANGKEGTFKPMATKYEGGELVAVFPDTKLPQGQYALRAVVRDAATNEGYVTNNVNGKRMVITNPLRDRVGLAFSATKHGKACKRKKAKTKAGKRKAAKLYKACKKKLAQGKGTDIQVSVRYGRALMLYGTLTDKTGQPIANQKIELYQQRAGDSLRLVGSATTDYAGQFGYKAPGGPTRKVIAYWPGTKTQQDVSASVRMGVATKVSLRVTPKVVRGARSFTFKGKVYAQDGVSAEGKLVQLQFYNYLRKRWQAGPALIRAGKGGNFKYKYRIKRGTAAKEKIMFRAFVPSESSWAYDAGTSRTQTIIHKR
jgi:hypothetical protein